MKYLLQSLLPYGKSNQEWPQILVILAASLSGFTCGGLFTWTSPSIPVLISNASHLTPITLEEASYFTVIPPIAAIFISPAVAVMVDIIGRNKTVAVIAVPQILAWSLIILAENITVFYVARIFAGIADAVLFTSLPMYVGEVAVPKVRGLWGNSVALSIYFGQFVVNIIGGYYGIRATASVFVIVPVIQLIISFWLPESPYYLLMKNRTEEARRSLQILRWKQNVDEELMTLTNDVNRQISESGSWKDLFAISTNRKALLVAVGIRAAQQFSGLPAFSQYTQYIFNQAGSNLSGVTSAIVFSGMLLMCISIAAFVVDKFGRRPMMMFSSFTCGIVVAVVAAYFYIYQQTTIHTSSLSWLPLTAMVVYIMFCSTGLGILPTLMLGELFSTSVKGKALCVANISFSVYVLTCSKVFQTLSSNFGMYVPFCMFSIFCFLSVIFSYYCVPETKGKTLEEIQQGLKSSKTDSECSNRYLNKI